MSTWAQNQASAERSARRRHLWGVSWERSLSGVAAAVSNSTLSYGARGGTDPRLEFSRRRETCTRATKCEIFPSHTPTTWGRLFAPYGESSASPRRPANAAFALLPACPARAKLLQDS